VREGWQTKRLGDVCAYLNRGVSPKYLDDGGICVLGQRCVRNHRVDYGYSRRHDLSAKKVPVERFVQEGDVLVNSTGVGSLGRVAQVRDAPSEPTTVDSHVTIVRPNSEEFFTDFFGYMMMTIEDAITEAGEGCGGQTELGRRTLAEKFVVRYPTSLAEQQRIVAILDEVFEDIATATANAEKNLANARAVFESYLNSAFTQRGDGWVNGRVHEIAGHSLGKMLDRQKNRGVMQPYVRTINVRWFEFDLSELNQMPFLAEEFDRYTAVHGDVLICEGGAHRGRAAIWTEDYPIHFQKAVHRVRFNEAEHGKWFLYYLYSQYMSGGLERHFTGTGIPHFTGESLARFEIPLPPLTTLRVLVAKFDEMWAASQHLETIYQRKLAALDALKQSLLHHAFSGQL